MAVPVAAGVVVFSTTSEEDWGGLVDAKNPRRDDVDDADVVEAIATASLVFFCSINWEIRALRVWDFWTNSLVWVDFLDEF